MATFRNNNTIDIVCATDTNYIPHTAVMLRSLRNTNPSHPFRIHVLCDNVDRECQLKVEKSISSIEIVWHEINDHSVLEFTPLLQISRATYLRLMMLELLDVNIKRILYLDVDMVVNEDITKLWNTDLQDNLIAAVIDPGMDAQNFAKRHNLQYDKNSYFNAGMFLMDLVKVRESKLMEKSIELLSAHDAAFEYADQCALNIVFWGKWKPLDLTWNFQRKFLYEDIKNNYKSITQIKNPKIIHFTEKHKPWNKDEWHPYAWLYLKYLGQTAYKNQVMSQGHITRLTALKWWLRWKITTKFK